MIKKIPQYVIEIIQKLETAGFEGFVVGGCVRDILLDKMPKDWDVATSAKPEELLKLFPDSVYENEFGTVGIKLRPIRIYELNPNLRNLRMNQEKLSML